MPTLTIDDQEITVEPGTVIIQACEQLGIEIPRFCYHERLAIAGNCRMCLVEVSPGPPKPQASCALPCADKMVVKTNTPMVKKAREGVMEFLLINHPLDCPICDQGGECDLQDQAMFYGQGVSRYSEHKRAVEDKYMGPLINTYMNRCIHCTRCVRFISDVAGVPELGGLGRGEHMEIGTYVEKALTSELSGNIVDLCPVGALTSKPYTYLARPWELSKTESIDVLDAVGSNIRIDSRGEAVLRVLPRIHEGINEEWIADKTRHACDGLMTQRLDRPYVRKDGKLQQTGWPEALQTVAANISALQPSQIAAVVGNQVNVESAFALKQLMQNLGVASLDCRQEGAQFATESRGDYLFNTTIAGIEKADAILLVGTNPRWEAPMVNARIYKQWRNANINISLIGEPVDLTYPCTYLGNNPAQLTELAKQALQGAKNPMIIVGTAALARPDGLQIYHAIRSIADTMGVTRADWNGFNILHHAAGRVGALDIGFLPQQGGRDMAGIIEGCASGEIKCVYLLGVDEIDMSLFGDAFVIYQGHHGDIGAHRADVILPGAAYTEQDSIFVNLEGRPQLAKRAVFPPGQAKEDWAIIRAISEGVRQPLPFNTLLELRQKLFSQVPHLAQIDVIMPATPSIATKKITKISGEAFEHLIANYYMTDPISRASRTMAECSKALLHTPEKRQAA